VVNEALQWAVLAIVGLLVLGALRQVALTLPSEARATSSGPPVGRRIPKQLLTALRRVSPSGDVAAGTLVAFVTESCVGCQRLLADLSNGNGHREDRQLVLIAKSPSRQFLNALAETGIPAVADATGDLWKRCGVNATPLVIRLDRDSRVEAKEVTHRVDGVAASAF